MPMNGLMHTHLIFRKWNQFHWGCVIQINSRTRTLLSHLLNIQYLRLNVSYLFKSHSFTLFCMQDNKHHSYVAHNWLAVMLRMRFSFQKLFISFDRFEDVLSRTHVPIQFSDFGPYALTVFIDIIAASAAFVDYSGSCSHFKFINFRMEQNAIQKAWSITYIIRKWSSNVLCSHIIIMICLQLLSYGLNIF